MAIAYIALGSNLGERESHIAGALSQIAAMPGVRILAVAALRETEPEDAPLGSGLFLNTAAAIETDVEPAALLRFLLRVECDLGRARSRDGIDRNAPRIIDLDLLLYDDRVIDADGLVLPHPRMPYRRFVLEPLAEIAPAAIHPLLGKTIQQLWDELRAAEAPAPADATTSKVAFANSSLHS